MFQHTGVREGGSAWCKVHPPQELLNVKIHESESEALLAEGVNYNLWIGKLGDP